jgi:uncharacterized protein
VKVVLDTNVFVSAILKKGSKPDYILRACLYGTIQLGLSKPLIDELGRVLHKPRLTHHHGWTDEQITRFLQRVRAVSDFVATSAELHILDSDPLDSFVLDCALNCHADYIVSGDPHLRDVHSYHRIPIITPARCVAELRNLGNQPVY